MPIYIKGSFPILSDFSDTLFFWSLRTIFGTCLSSVGNAGSIEGSSDDMISYTRKILDSSASDQNDTVFLEIMSDSRDVCRYFDTIGKTYPRYFTKS